MTTTEPQAQTESSPAVIEVEAALLWEIRGLVDSLSNTIEEFLLLAAGPAKPIAAAEA